jgi:uncharacterized membrane protein
MKLATTIIRQSMSAIMVEHLGSSLLAGRSLLRRLARLEAGSFFLIT